MDAGNHWKPLRITAPIVEAGGDGYKTGAALLRRAPVPLAVSDHHNLARIYSFPPDNPAQIFFLFRFPFELDEL